MGIIPQEPLLLNGSVRLNLDPFGEHGDEALQKALCSVGLRAELLDANVGAGASTLSAGQRQLLAFGRTLLREVRVVVMDEPTSNIDLATDESLQRIVREEFVNATTITIAHLLNTVIDCHRIFVMHAGQLAESGSAATLLEQESGHFAQMVDGLGEHAAMRLRERARLVT